MPPLEAGIVEWVNTFDLSAPCSSVLQLADGVALGQMLLKIAPGLFDLSTFQQEVGDNWFLKLNNLKKLVFNLKAFYAEHLGKEADFSDLDLTAVAREGSPEGMRALVQPLVGAAVTCSAKAHYIQAIMQMSVEGQATMQQMAQQAMGGMAAMRDIEDNNEEG
ncbi:unnamed protein product, partial [Discosporangium mesarthrocarpum]